MVAKLSEEEAKLLPTMPLWSREDDISKLPIAVAKMIEPKTSTAFIYAWISTIAFGLDYEETRRTIPTLLSPGPSSDETFPLGIVPQCVQFARRDMYDDGRICLHALEIIERLARVLKEADQSASDSNYTRTNLRIMTVKTLQSPGLTRQHAAINCLAAAMGYDIFMEFKPGEVLGLVVDLVFFVHFAHTSSALSEWSEPRLAGFQSKYEHTERCVTVAPSLTKTMPSEAFFLFKYTQDSLQEHWVMIHETALRVAVRALLFDHRLGLAQYSKMFNHRPDIVDQLLEIGSRHFVEAPHCEVNFLAMFILSLLLKTPGPHGYLAWRHLDELETLPPEFIQQEKQAFARNVASIGSRSGMMPKLIGIYERTYTRESYNYRNLYASLDPILERQGLPLVRKDAAFKLVLAARGRLKACCERILINLTYHEGGKASQTSWLLSVLPLAYTSCMRLPTLSEAEEKRELSWTRFERGNETYIYGDGHADAALECDSVLGRLLFLRMLNKAIELCSGSLDAIPSLGVGPGMQHLLKQVISLTSIEKIVRATIKRHIPNGLAAGNSYAERGELMRARWKFLATAELASSVIEFEQNPWFQQRWKASVEGGIPYCFTLLQRASQVCGLLGIEEEIALFEEAVLKDPRYSSVRSKLGLPG